MKLTPVDEEKWNSIVDLALLMNIVDVERSKAVDLDITGKHGKLVDLSLHFPPVKPLPPVRYEAFHVGEGNTVVPPCVVNLVWKPDEVKLLTQKTEVCIRDRQDEGLLSGLLSGHGAAVRSLAVGVDVQSLRVSANTESILV